MTGTVSADIRRIASLAWPVLVGQLANIAFGVIDTAMVGRYSAVDLAAIGLGSSIYVSIYIGLSGILSALQPITAHLRGARRDAEIGAQVREGFWLALVLTVLGMLFLVFPGPLLDLAHAPEALRARTVSYLQLLSWGMPAALLYRVFSSLANAIERPRLVMIMQVGALVLKVLLNRWLIFGGFGVSALGGPGCALASATVNWLLAVLAVLAMAKLDVFTPFGIFKRFSWPHWKPQYELARLGIPMGLSYLIEVTSYTFMAIFIARLGTATLAAHQIAGNLGAVLYMTPMSIGIATSTLVAQAIGRAQPDEARTLARHGVTAAVVIAGVFSLIVFVLRPIIIRGYTPNVGVAAAAMPLVAIVALYHLFDALQISTAFALRAYKVAVIPMVIYAVALWGVGLGGGYALGFNLSGTIPPWATGARGFWLANTASLAIAGVGLVIYLSYISKRHLGAKAR